MSSGKATGHVLECVGTRSRPNRVLEMTRVYEERTKRNEQCLSRRADHTRDLRRDGHKTHAQTVRRGSERTAPRESRAARGITERYLVPIPCLPIDGVVYESPRLSRLSQPRILTTRRRLSRERLRGGRELGGVFHALRHAERRRPPAPRRAHARPPGSRSTPKCVFAYSPHMV